MTRSKMVLVILATASATPFALAQNPQPAPHKRCALAHVRILSVAAFEFVSVSNTLTAAVSPSVHSITQRA